MKLKRIFLMGIIISIITACSSIPRNPFPPIKTPGIFIGEACSKIKKGDLQYAKERAYLEAMQDLILKEGGLLIKGYIEDYIKKYDGITTEGLNSFIKVRIYQFITQKNFEEFIDREAKVYWVRVKMTEEDFKRSVIETAEIRKKNFNLAKAYFDEGRQCTPREAKKARIYFQQAMSTLEEIFCESDYYVENDKQFILSVEVKENDQGAKERIKLGNIIYDEAEKLINRGKFNYARVKLEQAYKYLKDEEKYYYLLRRLEREESLINMKPSFAVRWFEGEMGSKIARIIKTELIKLENFVVKESNVSEADFIISGRIWKSDVKDEIFRGYINVPNINISSRRGVWSGHVYTVKVPVTRIERRGIFSFTADVIDTRTSSIIFSKSVGDWKTYEKIEQKSNYSIILSRQRTRTGVPIVPSRQKRQEFQFNLSKERVLELAMMDSVNEFIKEINRKIKFK